jgi:hypothetical protein
VQEQQIYGIYLLWLDKPMKKWQWTGLRRAHRSNGVVAPTETTWLL